MLPVVRLIESVSTVIGYLGAVFLLPLIVATCYEVLSRYLFGAPTIWAFELAYMCTGSLFLLGMAYTLKRQGHIRIDVLYENFTPRGQAAIDLAGYLIVLLPLLVVLSWYLLDYALEAYMSGERSGASAWNPIIWPFRFVFFVGFATLALQVIAEILKCGEVIIFGRPRGESPT